MTWRMCRVTELSAFSLTIYLFIYLFTYLLIYNLFSNVFRNSDHTVASHGTIREWTWENVKQSWPNKCITTVSAKRLKQTTIHPSGSVDVLTEIWNKHLPNASLYYLSRYVNISLTLTSSEHCCMSNCSADITFYM